MKTLLFSVTIHDCKVETFTCPGAGGGGKDTSNTGVRVTHVPSGASSKSCDSRSQLTNKRTAFRRMAESAEFRRWAKREAYAGVVMHECLDVHIDKMMVESNLRVETRDLSGKWVTLNPNVTQLGTKYSEDDP